MEYPCKKGTPSYDKQNKIFPQEDGKGKNPAMQTSLFNDDALSSEIPTNGKYAKTGKGATVNKSVFTSKSNQISPDASY